VSFLLLDLVFLLTSENPSCNSLVSLDVLHVSFESLTFFAGDFFYVFMLCSANPNEAKTNFQKNLHVIYF
jgi:hypothetical protein